ncbi:aldo/keto reductase [Novosphingobium mangrovi (ex Huang et al. 2023)]|uniref:Aldo/keto reductase n=1 Tax=Novosphingobium mangrovi (ex Huang et al. 2023) TaxID=2976432 RepID=A0ABT2I1W8_9SPHN|nr:aldo/keto reductase [Novosphingobium mangrovi (ex Huang et al. 2023)]MCT2398801.1 aldo/keto reductase [Novosphingobium mangrovi (ex Huang et al. 2023)]
MKRKLAEHTLNPVGLGCMNVAWAYGNPPAREDAAALFRHALDNGCEHFDTANIYGGGVSEEILHEAIMGRRQEFFLATKTGIVIDGTRRGVDCSPDAITTSLDASLKRLGTDHVDLFYMHRFDPKVPIADSVGAMVRAIEAGKIGAYGVSEWSAAHIREAHAVHPVAAVQTEYSLFTRNVELGVFDTTKDLGIALIAFSPVGRGALGGKLRDIDTLTEKDLRRTFPRFLAENWEKNLELIEDFNGLAAEAGVAPAQLALAWVLSRGDHVHVIPGTRSIAHWAENHESASLAIDAGILARAGDLINQQTVAGHRYPEMIRPTIDTEDFV